MVLTASGVGEKESRRWLVDEPLQQNTSTLPGGLNLGHISGKSMASASLSLKYNSTLSSGFLREY